MKSLMTDKGTFSRITPLTIVAMFLSLSEAVAGFAAINLEGPIQMVLVAFVIFFPIAIASVFFVILWNRPYVFYPPTEYSNGTTVTQFVAAMQQPQLSNTELITRIEEAVRGTLTSDRTLSELSRLEVPQGVVRSVEAADFLDDLAAKALDNIRENYITVEVGTEFGEKAGVYKVPYSTDKPLSTFANAVYFLLSPKVPAYSFGEVWTVVDARTGERFPSAEKQIIALQKKWKSGVFADEPSTPEDLGISPKVAIRPMLLRFPGT